MSGDSITQMFVSRQQMSGRYGNMGVSNRYYASPYAENIFSPYGGNCYMNNMGYNPFGYAYEYANDTGLYGPSYYDRFAYGCRQAGYGMRDGSFGMRDYGYGPSGFSLGGIAKMVGSLMLSIGLVKGLSQNEGNIFSEKT